MIGKLIFIRHGKAKPLANGQVDSLRALTSKGKKEIEKMIPVLKDNLDNDMQLYLFSSFSLRSIQTAEIIAKEIGIKKIGKYEWVESGDIDFLEKEIKQKQSPFCIIIVGHNPYLSEWSHHMSGYFLPYKKGTMVGFTIISLEPLKAQPQWFLQADSINAKAINIKNNKPVLHEFQKIMICQLQKIFQIQKQFWLMPSKPALISRLYIETSIFCAQISFLKPLLDKERHTEAIYQMQEFTKRFEYIEQLDKLAEEWTKYISINYERLTKDELLLQKIKDERDNEILKIYPEVIKNMISILFNLYIWIKNNFEGENLLHEDLQAELTFEEYTTEHFKAIYKKTKKMLSKNDFLDSDMTQKLKLQVRDLRDILYSIESHVNLYMRDELEQIIALQDHLDLICNMHNQLKIIKDATLKHNNILRDQNSIYQKYLTDKLSEQIIEIKQYKFK
jgi:phosphohistidine phosphatase